MGCGFLLLFTLQFLDIKGLLPPPVTRFAFDLQFIPALLSALHGSMVSLLILLGIVGVTLLLGRVYCSTVCPLGLLQDLILRIRSLARPRVRFSYHRPFSAILYVIVAATIVLVATGSAFFLILLDPYSLFGRIMVSVPFPLAMGANNLAATLFGWMGTYTVSSIHIPTQSAIVIIVGGGLLAGLVILTWYRGRLFCNLLCPVGGFLSLLSRYSLFRLAVNEHHCNFCSLCEKVCKAEAIDYEKKILDMSACVGCYNCVGACPTVGFTFRFPWQSTTKPEPIVDPARRKLVLQSAGVIALTAGAPLMSTVALDKENAPSLSSLVRPPVTPPGALATEHFTSHCTSCYRCVSVCPTHVLRPSFLSYGIGGIFQPEMDFAVSFCNYTCTLCGEVCPTEAITPLALETKKLVQIGKARFIKEECIVITKKKDCGACSEHCPTKAVHMVKQEGLFLPEVREELCIGCGACEYACPTRPTRAIFVVPNQTHAVAKKPEVKEERSVEAPLMEFPF